MADHAGEYGFQLHVRRGANHTHTIERKKTMENNKNPRELNEEELANAAGGSGWDEGGYFVDPEKCVGCGTCVDECPMGCISLGYYAMINQELCVQCGICEYECIFNAVERR